MADAITAALPAQTTPQGYYNVERMLKSAFMDLLGSLEGTITSGDRFLEQDEAAVGAVFNADDTGIEYWYVPSLLSR